MAVKKVTLIAFIVNVKQVQMGNNLPQKCSVILKVFPSVLGQSLQGNRKCIKPAKACNNCMQRLSFVTPTPYIVPQTHPNPT